MKPTARYLEHMQAYYGRQCEAFTALAKAMRPYDREIARQAIRAARASEKLWDQMIDQRVDLEEMDAAEAQERAA